MHLFLLLLLFLNLYVKMQWVLYTVTVKAHIQVYITAMYSRSKKKKRKRNTPIYFNSNYRTKINRHGLLPTSVWCLKSFLIGPSTWGGGVYLIFNFFNVNHHIFQRNLKVPLSNCQETNFPTLARELLDVGIIANASF